jgi:hypothetical protein
MNKVIILTSIVLFAGCSSMPEVKLGSEMTKREVKIKLAASAQVIVLQPLSLKGATCEKAKEAFQVEVRSETTSDRYETRENCGLLKNQVAFTTKKLLPEGAYRIIFKQTAKVKVDEVKPSVYARYEDADFNSGTDFVLEGAKEFAEGTPVKGVISYPEGNATDWYRLKGKNQMVTLTYLENAANDIHAQVYEAADGGKARLIANLEPKQRKSFKVANDNILVKVSAKSFMGKGAYSLLRLDKAGGGSLGEKLAVIDCYQISDNQAAVLLKATDTVKMNDAITVYAKKATGESQSIGECNVEAVAEGQASCTLNTKVSSDFVEFFARKRAA